MKYPRLEIHLDVIRQNAQRLHAACVAHGVQPVGIVKVCGGQPEVAATLLEVGYQILGDSRLEDIARYRHLPCETMLIRLPMISEADRVVELADYSLNSEIATVEALSAAAARQGRIHRVIAMLELGDLREGCPTDEALGVLCRRVVDLPNLELAGLGANFVCYGGAKPSTQALKHLVACRDALEAELGVRIPMISGGSSTAERLMMAGGLPEGVNQLRTGALIHVGIGLMDERIEGYRDDAYRLRAEVIESNVKPSMPYGELGTDAFGQVRRWEDRGRIRRCIVAIGRQDMELECLEPMDAGIRILGGSSDHLLLELADGAAEYRIGDVVEFKVGYVGVMRACTSPYVEKVCVSRDG
ncbi:MAG: alanine/ornithine racemase family PLP-dependent enzyme [Clostridia bacterium]|nr:alanine/ornithine racemase family PLP-dependent enzyme [Clostridia bacterium]